MSRGEVWLGLYLVSDLVFLMKCKSTFRYQSSLLAEVWINLYLAITSVFAEVWINLYLAIQSSCWSVTRPQLSNLDFLRKSESTFG